MTNGTEDPANDQAGQQFLETIISCRARNKSKGENIAGHMICSTPPALLDMLRHRYILGTELDVTAPNIWYYLAFGSGAYHTSWGHNSSSVFGYLASISPEIVHFGYSAINTGLEWSLMDWQGDVKTIIYKAMVFGVGAYCGKLISDYSVGKKSGKVMEGFGRGMSFLFRRH